MTKFLVMKAHFSSDVCVDTPSAFVAQLDNIFVEFLKTFTENSAPFLENMKKHGFCKTDVNAYFGDWLCLKEDQDTQEEKFWEGCKKSYRIVDEQPEFFCDATEAGVDVYTQTVSCDNPALINFKADLYDGTVEVFTDDVLIQLLADAIGYSLPKIEVL
jgi:hypothetical protein